MSRRLRMVVAVAIFLVGVSVFWKLNTRTQVLIVDKAYKAWGWPIGIWGSGIPGDFGDPIEIGVMVLNGIICIFISAVCSALFFMGAIFWCDKATVTPLEATMVEDENDHEKPQQAEELKRR